MYYGAESIHRYLKLTLLSDGNLVFSKTTNYICSFVSFDLRGLDIGMALMRAEGNKEYSYDHGCGLVLVLGWNLGLGYILFYLLAGWAGWQ